jgi:hypothetical protein
MKLIYRATVGQSHGQQGAFFRRRHGACATLFHRKTIARRSLSADEDGAVVVPRCDSPPGDEQLLCFTPRAPAPRAECAGLHWPGDIWIPTPRRARHRINRDSRIESRPLRFRYSSASCNFEIRCPAFQLRIVGAKGWCRQTKFHRSR